MNRENIKKKHKNLFGVVGGIKYKTDLSFSKVKNILKKKVV